MTPSENQIEYYTANLLKNCFKCKKPQDRNKHEVLDSINGTVCEANYLCGYCGYIIDFWAYGSSSVEQESDEFEREFPMAAKLIKRMVKNATTNR